MKITTGEKNKLISDGILTLLCLTAILGIILYFSNYLVQKELDTQNQMAEANKNVLATNRRDAKETKFLRENQKSIDTMWSTLKNWGKGVTPYDVENFDAIGMINKTPIPPTKIPSNPIEYAGIKIMGGKTEYQRLVQAISSSESSSGLLQIKSCIFQLPSNTVPYNLFPTYLDAQLEILGPISQ